MTFSSISKTIRCSNIRAFRWVCRIRVSPLTKIVDFTKTRNLLTSFNGFTKTSSLSNSVPLHLKLNSVRGIQHRFRLPVNGQRTKTNANTRKSLRSVIVK